MPDPKMSKEAREAYAEALRRMEVCHRDGKEDLDLSGLGLTELPREIGQLTALTRLVLYNNQLTTLPPEIGQLSSLTELSLFGNQLTTLPSEFSQLSALTLLSLNDNQLMTLPPEFGQLSALMELTLNSNELTRLSPEFGQLSALMALRLDDNHLTALPPEFGQLSALRVLFLNDNQLTTLSPEIGKLSALTFLDLSGNQLMTLPREISRLRVLEKLYLHGNPRLAIPQLILGPSFGEENAENPASSPGAVLGYYFAIQGNAGRALREVKLILVGRGEVGKSSMADGLRGLPFVKNRPRTDGITITPWPLSLPDGEAKVVLWDFGGQEIMHGTHQFFLTHRSLYVVMVDGRHDRGKQDAEYWLKLVRAFGGESPVLVVMNRQKEHPFDIDRQYLADKYDVKLEHFFRTDCERGDDVEHLSKAIQAEVARMLSSEEKFPGKCWDVKVRLESMKEKGEDYLSEEGYAEVCAKHGVDDPKEQAKLLRRLADLGTVVSFPDDVKLADFSVLNPEWATDGIYRVVTDEALREKKHGVLRRTALRQLLPEKRWPKPKHLDYLVELMKKFELCFAVGDEEKEVLVTELLPDKTPPLADWEAEKCVVFIYDYPVLPHGVLPRFITRTHPLSEGHERWRTGAVLADDGAEALVKADYDANTVSVWVRGRHANARRALLKVVRHHFDQVHSRIRDLKPQELVALRAHPEVLQPYSDLVQDERDGKKTIRVTVRDQRLDVPIANFLDCVEPPAKRRKAAKERRHGRVIHVEPGGEYHEHHKSMNQDSHDTKVTARDITGAQIGGQGNTQKISDSFKTIGDLHGKELARLFQQLDTQIPPVKDEMKGKDIKMLEEHAAKLTAEAAKPKEEQDRSQLSLSGEGMIEAAETVGKIAGPVIATTKAILTFFGIPLP